MPKLPPKPEITPEQRERIAAFCAELKTLCDKHRLDIEATVQMPDYIGIIDRDVPDDAPQRDYSPWEAYITGCRREGVGEMWFEDFEGWGK